jgi:nondiscriminating aspartyl-tRNA synthetase
MTTIPAGECGIPLASGELAGMAGSAVTLHGMVMRIRKLSWGAFVVLRRHDGLVQCIISGNGMDSLLEGLSEEQSVEITGLVKEAVIKDPSIHPNNVEIHLESLRLLSSPFSRSPVDLSKKVLDLHIDNNLDLRPLSLRHPVERARLKVAEGFCRGFRQYLQGCGFTEIHTPKICLAGAEGGANIFPVKYFEREAFLAQSPQFYKQIGVGIYERVFETGPVFRAEPHQTSRHVNEYTSLDFEMGFIEDHTDVMKLEVDLLRYCLELLQREYAPELSLLSVEMPEIPDRVPCVTLAEAHAITGAMGNTDYSAEPDLEPEEERLLCRHSALEWGSDFVFVTHFPTEKRPFYTMDDPEAPGTTRSFDLLFRGLEITTGGQRIHDYGMQVDKMKLFGLEPDDFKDYLQAHMYGLPPHGGLAIGLERLTARFLGVDNIRYTTMFPRDIKRLAP